MRRFCYAFLVIVVVLLLAGCKQVSQKIGFSPPALTGEHVWSMIDSLTRETNSIVVEQRFLGRSCVVEGSFASLERADGGGFWVVFDPNHSANYIIGEAPVAVHARFAEGARDSLGKFTSGAHLKVRGNLTNFNKTQGEYNYRLVLSECELLDE